MSGIFWLASFPKSGNTWMRAFLTELTQNSVDEKSELDINWLSTGAIGSSREWIQNALGFEIGELTHDEIDRLRPMAYSWIAENSKTGFHKIHDAYTYLKSGEPLIPASATQGVIYLVRNPLDVAVSYANHNQIELDTAVEQVCSPGLVLCEADKKQAAQLRQILMSWSDHVESWLSAELTKLCVRYEDLKYDSLGCFARVARFLHIDRDREEIQLAVDATAFEVLSALEKEQGFTERANPNHRFFRQGKVGDWQNHLSDNNVQQIIDTHGETMRKLGYLDARGGLTDLTLGQNHSGLMLYEEPGFYRR